MEISPVVVHIPHTSVCIPAEYHRDFLLSGENMRRELLRMTDRYCDELFDVRETRVVAPISRLVCDVERFRADEDEPMSVVGMGAVYTMASLGLPLRSLNRAQRDKILREVYDPHHRLLTETVTEKLNLCGRCLIIDGHSFSAVPLPHERGGSRPDFCIGRDDYHTPDALVSRIAQYIRSLGYRAAVNAPFSGSMVPLCHYRRERRVSSVMIEINRGLYMDGQGMKTKEFNRTRQTVRAICQCCKAYADEISR